MSQLPISETTLAYGSANAGKRIETGEHCPELPAHIRKIASAFHLKEHNVGSTETPKKLCTPVDLEAHSIHGRYYLLDFSRFFPPTFPGNDIQGPYGKLPKLRYSPYFRLFRYFCENL
jgi:hypothetical protein